MDAPDPALTKKHDGETMLNTLRDILDFRLLPEIAASNRTLLWQFVKRSVSARYKGSMLGIFWSFVQPMMMLCVYTFVFSVVFRSRWGVGEGGGRGSFAIIMFCGLALFNLFSEAVTLNSGIVVSNPNLVKKVIFPLEILPLSQTIASFAVGMVWFLLLFLGAVFVFGKLSFTMLLLPLILVPLFLFTLGVSFFTASLGVYVRDTPYAVGVVLQILFFMTPIFYPVSAIPERFRWPILLNPLTLLIEEARKVFLYGELPDWRFLGAAFLISLLVLHLGFLWFHKTKKGFADVL